MYSYDGTQSCNLGAAKQQEVWAEPRWETSPMNATSSSMVGNGVKPDAQIDITIQNLQRLPESPQVAKASECAAA